MIRRFLLRILAAVAATAFLHPFAPRAFPAIRDVPFFQDVSEKFTLGPELAGAGLKKVLVDGDENVFVLTDRGVARVFPSEKLLTQDRTYRPLIGTTPRDITLFGGAIYYLVNDQLISNGHAGLDAANLGSSSYQFCAIATENTAIVSGARGALWIKPDGSLPMANPTNTVVEKLYSHDGHIYALTENGVHVFRDSRFHQIVDGRGITALGFRGTEIIIGTQKGYYTVSASTGQVVRRLKTKLPVVEINCLEVATNGIWFGTPRGVFLEENSGEIRYYASQRWLKEDAVVDLALDGHGGIYALGPTSLSAIRYTPMTLAQKAAYFEERLRERHIRYGLCSDLQLTRPGDVASGQLIDTDYDGSWSEYYLCSEALRYASTHDEKARANAWETFSAIERLVSLTGLPGYPARSFERTTFKVNDPEWWRPSPEKGWEWKSNTSSDEVMAHWLGCSMMLECVVRTPEERQRVTVLLDVITRNVAKNDFQLIDWNGKPTHWGRWNPTYVNAYPISVFDRRLNSQEIVGGLELAFKTTHDTYFRDRLQYLVDQGIYLENIRLSMTNLKVTNYLYDGDDMGDVWNHGDDLPAFASYWVLSRWSLTPEMRSLALGAVQDHFRMERNERCPLWNFIYASVDPANADTENAVWTLRRLPMDTITWKIQNSHRRDITKLPANFREQELAELLPPGERPTSRLNAQPFILDGGDGGNNEFSGEEFLLPYWMGRYLKLIE